MIIIRADGGSGIGHGHLIRTGALANELLAQGFDVTYATATPGPVSDMCPADIEVVNLPVRDDPGPFVSWLNGRSIDAVVADSYLVDTDYMRAVRSAVPVFAVFSDDGRFEIEADVIINGNLYADSIEYEYRGSEPDKLLGPKFLSLRSEVREVANNPAYVSEYPERALVTIGGSDVQGFTLRGVRAFDDTQMTVDAVLGPGVNKEYKSKVADAVSDLSIDVNTYYNPENFLQIMHRSDVAISSCGTTTYELLSIGTPFVGVVQVDNQKPIARSLSQRGLAKTLSLDTNDNTLKQTVHALIDDVEFRSECINRGKQLIDGLGARRICGHLVEKCRG